VELPADLRPRRLAAGDREPVLAIIDDRWGGRRRRSRRRFAGKASAACSTNASSRSSRAVAGAELVIAEGHEGEQRVPADVAVPAYANDYRPSQWRHIDNELRPRGATGR